MSATEQFYSEEEIRQRLSISTLVFRGFRPIGENTLEELARCGIHRIELLESPEQFDLTDSRSMRFLGQVCRSCGIQVRAYHAHRTNFSEIETEAQRRERVDLCRRQIDTLLELDGRVWGCHARVTDGTLVRCYEELAQHVEGTEAVITVENFSAEGLWVEDRMAFLDRIDHPQVGLILDIGHVRNHAGVNPMTLPGGPTQILKLCGPRLLHVHLHGFKEGKDHHPPLVEGDEIQWMELFRQFYALGYPGDFNFEPSGEPLHADAVGATARMPERMGEAGRQ